MGFARVERRMAAAGGRSCRLHRTGVPAQQRLHLAAVLVLALATPSFAQDDISFDPALTQEQFHLFTAMVGQALFPSPVNPGDSGELLGFDVGIAATAIPIDEEALYWVRSVENDFTRNGYLIVPRIIASKGIGIGNLSASYAQVPDSDVKVLGGSFDLPLIRGGLVKPTLVLRATYGQLQGVDVFKLTTYGGEAILGKGFGPLTPYVGAGMTHVESEGLIEGIPGRPAIELSDDFEQERYTAGVRFSLLLLKIILEANRAEDTTFSAKVSLGL